jgi:rod shape-determining protein MreC
MYRRAGRGRLLLLSFIALSVVVITLDFRQGQDGPLERAKEISTAIVAPIQRGITTVFRPVGNFFSSVADLSDLRTENRELKAQVETQEAEITEAQSLSEENIELRELLELDESWATMDRVTAQVIATSPFNYQWSVIIDKGRADGVEPNMAVINADGLVGKIVRADANTSTIRLLIDPQAAARARIKDEHYTGTVQGNGAQEALSFDFVDPAAEVNPGDDVVTSGYDEGVYPPSIPIGEVIAASGEGAELDQDIDVRPWVNFTGLDFVQVIVESGRVVTGEEE